MWEREVVSAMRYLETVGDPLVQGAVWFVRSNMTFSVFQQADQVARHRGLPADHAEVCSPSEVCSNREVAVLLESAQHDELRAVWGKKVIHRVYQNKLEKDAVDKEASWRWLAEGKLQAETEALVVAA